MAQILYDGKPLVEVEDANKVSDGDHTFGELYDHRCVLFLAFLETRREKAWKSRKHADGREWPGWFIAGVNILDNVPITYRLLDKYWTDCRALELAHAPEWDGHTSADVLDRLLTWVQL